MCTEQRVKGAIHANFSIEAGRVGLILHMTLAIPHVLTGHAVKVSRHAVLRPRAWIIAGMADRIGDSIKVAECLQAINAKEFADQVGL